MFSTVIFIRPPYILSKSSQSCLAHEYSYLQNTLNKILSKADRSMNLLINLDTSDGRYINSNIARPTPSTIDIAVMTDRACPPAYRPATAFNGFASSSSSVIASSSRPCKALVAVYKRSKEAENAPHKRCFSAPRTLPAFHRPLLQVYGAVRSRQAIAAVWIPRIITPSITACPPIFDLNFSLLCALLLIFFPFKAVCALTANASLLF